MQKGFILVSILLLVCFSSTNIFGECIQGDCKHGQGIYIYPDGWKYVGQWENDRKHGYGTMTHPDGTKYEGEWKNNLPNGQGTITFPDGRKRVGVFKDGEYVGK